MLFFLPHIQNHHLPPFFFHVAEERERPGTPGDGACAVLAAVGRPRHVPRWMHDTTPKEWRNFKAAGYQQFHAAGSTLDLDTAGGPSLQLPMTDKQMNTEEGIFFEFLADGPTGLITRNTGAGLHCRSRYKLTDSGGQHVVQR